jgi:hypothetical protein
MVNILSIEYERLSAVHSDEREHLFLIIIPDTVHRRSLWVFTDGFLPKTSRNDNKETRMDPRDQPAKMTAGVYSV